jgi:hypothetical protein
MDCRSISSCRVLGTSWFIHLEELRSLPELVDGIRAQMVHHAPAEAGVLLAAAQV